MSLVSCTASDPPTPIFGKKKPGLSLADNGGNWVKGNRMENIIKKEPDEEHYLNRVRNW